MAGSKSANRKEDVAEQLAQVREDIQTLAGTVAALAASEAQGAGTEALDRAAALGERGREAMERARDRAMAAERSAIQHVRERPLQSMAIAAAIGLAVGWIARDA